MKKAQVGFLTR